MPRFLRSKRKVALGLLILFAIILFVFKVWYLAFFSLIGIMLLLVDREILSRCNKTLCLLSAQREISQYGTFIIGDMCPSDLCCIEDALVMTAPGRSLEASYQILLHTISGLKENGTCVITHDGKSPSAPFSIFDVGYLSLVSRKELGLDSLMRKASWPLFFDPLRSIKYLLEIIPGNYHESVCPSEDIKRFCTRKNIKLVYLVQV